MRSDLVIRQTSHSATPALATYPNLRGQVLESGLLLGLRGSSFITKIIRLGHYCLRIGV